MIIPTNSHGLLLALGRGWSKVFRNVNTTHVDWPLPQDLWSSHPPYMAPWLSRAETASLLCSIRATTYTKGRIMCRRGRAQKDYSGSLVLDKPPSVLETDPAKNLLCSTPRTLCVCVCVCVLRESKCVGCFYVIFYYWILSLLVGYAAVRKLPS